MLTNLYSVKMVLKKDSSRAMGDAVYAQISNPLLVKKEMLLVVLESAKMMKHYKEHIKLQERKDKLRKKLGAIGEELKVLLDDLKLKGLPHVKSENKIIPPEGHKKILIEESDIPSAEEDVIEKEIRDIEEKIRNL